MKSMARPQEFDTIETLRQAMRVFWRKGYEATSMTDLLDATGLSKSSLYGAFGSKRELFLTAFDVYREERVKDMWRVLRLGTARHAISSFFEMIVAETRSDDPKGCMSINQAVEMAPRDADIRARVLSDFRLIEDALAQTIERGRSDGSIDNTRSARELAGLLVLLFPGLQVMVRAGFDQARLDDWLRVVLANLD